MKKILAIFLFTVLLLTACDMFNVSIPDYLRDNVNNPNPPNPPGSEVYLWPTAPDDGDGTETSPVKTIAAAEALLGNNISPSSPATIWVMGTIILTANESLDGENSVIVKRYGCNATETPEISACTGALINVTSGTLTLANIIIDGQGDVNNLGGSSTTGVDSALITVESGGTLQLNNGATLQNNNNTSTDGGCVLVSANGTLIMEGGTITNNIASASGGGVFIDTSGTLNLGAGTAINISGNTLISGGVNNVAYTNTVGDSPVNVTGILASGTIIGLSPTNLTAGAMLVKANSDIIKLAYFTRDDVGGGIIKESFNLIVLASGSGASDYYINSDGTGTGTTADSPTTFNVANLNIARGQTIWIMNTIAVGTSESWNLDSTTTGVTVKRYDGHDDLTPTVLEGALVHVSNGATLTLANIIIDGQGGIMAGDVDVVGTITATSAIINITNNGTLKLNTGAILQNNSNNDQNGGGVSVAGTLTIDGGKIRNNTSGNGGGVYMQNGTFTLTTGEITDNKATTNGGGVKGNGTFKIDGGIVRNNSADGSGGGVCIDGGTLTITNNGEITNNTATINGGGVISGGNVTINGGKISNNNADGSGSKGGGVYMQNGIFTLTAGEISNNTATGNGGGIRLYDGIHTISGGTITTNVAANGAGIYLEGNGSLKLGGVGTINISGNTLVGSVTPSNIAYTNLNLCPVKIAGNITLADATKKIGLSPSKKTLDTVVAQADGVTLTPAIADCFTLDEGSNFIGISVNDLIIIPPVAMASVTGGKFIMGAVDIAEPPHEVTLSNFSMGITEITQKQWLNVMEANPLGGAPSSDYGVGDTHPIYFVSWYDAVKFCNALSTREGLAPYYTIISATNVAIVSPETNGYRLPTEAEWEYAARGGNNNNEYLYSGSNDIGEVVWYSGNNSISGTKPVGTSVGTKIPNALELYDMSGNVSEWCWDRNGSYSDTHQTNPTGAVSGAYRVSRGGNYGSTAGDCRVAMRLVGTPSDSISSRGFRVVRSLP